MPEIKIVRLGLKGDGVTEDGRFIPFSLPGEVYDAPSGADDLSTAQRRTCSDARIAPVCPHFGTCGGCALQHASAGFLAEWKRDTIAFALKAQALETTFRPIAASPPYSRRRATFSARRTKKTTQVGFHLRATDTVLPLETCHLLKPDLMAALPACHALAGLGASRKGEIKITLTHSSAGPDIAVFGAKPLDGPLRAGLASLANAHAIARLCWNGEPIADRSRPVQIMGKARVLPPSGAFLQATDEGEATLVSSMREAVAGARSVVDLFAGCGTFTLPLAEQATVHAVEGEAEMLEALNQGWRFAEGLKTVSTEPRDLFRRPLVPSELSRYDAVVIDPPRAGAKAQIEEIAASGITLVGAVSCNPVTFARDARILVDAGFSLDWVQPVDQFLWSGHVELAARFSRA